MWLNRVSIPAGHLTRLPVGYLFPHLEAGLPALGTPHALQESGLAVAIESVTLDKVGCLVMGCTLCQSGSVDVVGAYLQQQPEVVCQVYAMNKSFSPELWAKYNLVIGCAHTLPRF